MADADDASPGLSSPGDHGIATPIGQGDGKRRDSIRRVPRSGRAGMNQRRSPAPMAAMIGSGRGGIKGANVRVLRGGSCHSLRRHRTIRRCSFGHTMDGIETHAGEHLPIRIERAGLEVVSTGTDEKNQSDGENEGIRTAH